MSSPELLITRIRGEFREMPGLRLTFAQACRLWQVEPEACDMVLRALLAESFLTRTADGRFVALPTLHTAGARPVGAVREPSRVTALQLRRPA